MKVDSRVMVMVKGSVFSKDMDCYSCASTVQLLLPGMSFQLFGMRTIEQFGQRIKILRKRICPQKTQKTILIINFIIIQMH
jgi:hypothetical protein